MTGPASPHRRRRRPPGAAGHVRRPPRQTGRHGGVRRTLWLVIVVELAAAGLGLAAARRPSSLSDPVLVQGRAVSSMLAGPPQRTGVDRTRQAAAVQEMLSARANAVLRRDRTAFLATVDPVAVELRERQATLFDNLAEVPIASWAYELDPRRETPLPPGLLAVYGDDLWAPRVLLRFAFTGYDGEPTVQEQRYMFVRHGDRWSLTDDGTTVSRPGAGSVRNLWDFGPVRALAGPYALVLGHPGDERLMNRILRGADAAVPQVSAVWGRGWTARVVILVPSDTEELAHLVEVAGDVSRIAAFASADVPQSGPPTGKRIVVNPAVFPDLTPVGQQVVLTHEISHVAARDVTSAVTPYWLAEGFADYVAYRGSEADDRIVARELADEVRRGRLPRALPGRVEFATGNPRLPQVYSEAWLACRLIVERAGEAGLVRLYLRASGAAGAPARELDAALRSELGLSTAEFTDLWRAYVKEKLA